MFLYLSFSTQTQPNWFVKEKRQKFSFYGVILNYHHDVMQLARPVDSRAVTSANTHCEKV
jgi:hypothetical protein